MEKKPKQPILGFINATREGGYRTLLLAGTILSLEKISSVKQTPFLPKNNACKVVKCISEETFFTVFVLLSSQLCPGT